MDANVSHGRVYSWILIIGLVGLLAVTAVPTQGTPTAAGVPPHAESVSTGAGSAPIAVIAPSPSVAAYAIGTHKYTLTAPTSPGVQLPGSYMAVDNESGTVYTAYGPGYVTIINGSTGALIAQRNLFTAGSSMYVYGLAVDPALAHLYVSVYNSAAGAGYLWVLSTADFSLVRNITGWSAIPNFIPGQISVESNTSRILVLNESDSYGNVQLAAFVINPITLTVAHSFSFACSTYCSITRGDINDIPTQNLLVIGTGTPYYYLINPLNYTTEQLPLGPSFVTGPSAFDATDNYWYLTNVSYLTPTPILVAGISSFYPIFGLGLGQILSPSAISTLGWDGQDALLVSGAQNVSTGGEEIDVYGATSTSPLAAYDAPVSVGIGSPYESFFADIGSVTYSIFASYAANLSQAFALSASLPYLTPGATFAPSVGGTFGVGVDGLHGIAVEGTFSPTAIRGYYLSNGTQAWVDYQSSAMTTTYAATDTFLGRTYVSHGIASHSVEVYSTATGAYLGYVAIPTGAGAGNLYVDQVHNLLFAVSVSGTLRNISVLQLNGTVGSYLGQIVPPLGTTGQCGVTPDALANRVWMVSGCGANGNAEAFNETSFAWIENVTTVHANMYNVGSDGQGHVFFENTNGTNSSVGVYNDLTDTWMTNMTGIVRPGGYDADTADGLLWIATSTLTSASQSVSAYAIATGALEGQVALPQTWIWNSWTTTIGWSAETSTLAVPEYGGGLALLQQVPYPTVPGGVTATRGNASVAVAWAASSGSPGFPVTGYVVTDSTSASGPWTVAASVTAPDANVTGLTNGVPYFFEVRAQSAAGNSSYSSAVSATPATTPYPPTAVTASGTGTDRVNVSWSAPSDTGGSAITGYTVEYAASSSGPWKSVPAGTAVSFVVTGLNSSTTYYFRVVAVNAVGTSSPSAVASAATKTPESGFLGLGGSTGYLVLGIVLAAVVIIALVLLLRRRPSPPAGTGPSAPPGAATPPPPPPPTGAPPPSPPPGAAGPP